MVDELIDIYDENNKPLGISKMKSEAHAKGLWHRVVHIWVFNSKKDILLQLRSKNMEIYPDTWEISASGHVGAGESPIDAALRELHEEIGIDCKKESMQFVKILHIDYAFRDITNREFGYVYLLYSDCEIEGLSIQEEEVQKIAWFPIKKLQDDLTAHKIKYVEYKNYWMDMLQVIEKKK